MLYGASEGAADSFLLWRPSSSTSNGMQDCSFAEDTQSSIEKESDRSQHSSKHSNRSLTNNFLSAVGSSLSLPGRRCSVRDLGGTASVPNEILNLVKNTVGCGVLSIPMGIAAVGNTPSALIAAAMLTAFMGSIFGYYFLLLGRVCDFSSAATYREAWEETVGSNGSVAVTFFNMLQPAISVVAFSMILADTFQALLTTAGFGLSRALSLLLITVVALLPLCLMKNLEVLAPFSILGLAGLLFTTCAIMLRYFDHTYDLEREGKFLEDLPDYLKPSFGDIGWRGVFSFDMFVLVCMLYASFVVHYNAPVEFIFDSGWSSKTEALRGSA